MTILTKDIKNIYKTVDKIANKLGIQIGNKIKEETLSKIDSNKKQEPKEEYTKIGEIDENNELYQYFINSDNNAGNEKTAKYNEKLLNVLCIAQNGNSEFLNILIKVGGSFCLMITIISIIMLYSSFKITCEERIKELGVLASIGCSKKQKNSIIRKEAIILGTIGIALGIIIGIILSKLLINVVDILLKNCIYDTVKIKYIASRASFHVKVPLLGVVISIVIIYLIIFIANKISIRKINKINIIEAIKSSDNINIAKKQMKVPQIIQKTLGTEGIIAYKNIKRDKSKYRTILISLIINIILVLSILGGITNYYKTGVQGALLEISKENIDGDYSFITYDMKNTKRLIQYLTENNLMYGYSVYECIGAMDEIEITDNLDEYLNSPNKMFKLKLQTDKMEEIEKRISEIEDILERKNFNWKSESSRTNSTKSKENY